MKEVAALFGLHLGGVYELLQDGTIPAKQFRRRWIISRNQFHAWLDSSPEHDWPLSKIDHVSVQEWVAQLGGRLAPATVRECYRVLALVLGTAVQARLLVRNPCDGVRLPPRRSRTPG